MRICSIIIFNLIERWKAKLYRPSDVVFLVRLRGKFEIDHSWEWKAIAKATRNNQWIAYFSPENSRRHQGMLSARCGSRLVREFPAMFWCRRDAATPMRSGRWPVELWPPTGSILEDCKSLLGTCLRRKVKLLIGSVFHCIENGLCTNTSSASTLKTSTS